MPSTHFSAKQCGRHREERDRVEQVAGHERHEDVQLEVTLHPADGDRRVVADHLSGDLRDDLGDDRVDLPGHDRAALLELRQEDLGEARTRAGAHQADVVRDLRQRDGDRLQRAGSLDEGVARGLGLERIGRRDDRADPSRPESAARTRAANSGCVFRPVPVAVPPSGIWPSRGSVASTRAMPCADLCRVAGELLAQRHRDGVHEMGAAGLDDVVELGSPSRPASRRAGAAPAAARASSSSSAAR